MAGDAAEGVYITGWVDFSNLNDPGVQKFFEIWGKYYPMTTHSPSLMLLLAS